MLVGLGAATFLVLRGDGRNGFWAGHPMLGALVSGAFLFVVGVVVVDRYISHRNARRWHTVSIAADRELGHLIDETLKVMWTAHSEPDPHASRRTVVEWTPASRATDVRPGREQLEPASRRLAAFRSDLPEPDYTGVTLTPVDRLETLLHDEDFVRFARDLVARCRDEVRESVKGWAALMMWAEQSQRLLNYLSVFAEVHLSDIEYFLAGWTPQNAEKHARKAAQLWSLADVKARVLLNTLWGASTPYRLALPQEVEHLTLAGAFRETDRVGRWRPPPHRPLSVGEARRERAARIRRRLLPGAGD